MEQDKFTDNEKSNSRKNPKYKNKSKLDKLERGSRKSMKDNIPSRNNWEFYAASEQIAKDIASIPFNYMGGTNFPLQATRHNGATTVTNASLGAIPGVMSIYYTTTPGYANQATNAVNMAAVQTYTYVRHKNSGAKNYEAADIMMYILAMGDIYSEFFEAKRIYGTASLFNFYNHNLPKTILEAANIDVQDLRNNIAQYRGRLNIIARKINSFAVPKYFKVFARRAFISSYLFTDSDSIRSQFYQFNRAGYYKWDTTSSEAGTMLKYTSHSTASHTLGSRLDILESMLDALFLDEDALTMSGDILKAYGDSELYTVAETNEEYVVSVLKDDDVLSQIENMTTVYLTEPISTVPTFSLDITQANQVITYQPKVTYSTLGSTNTSKPSFVLDRLVLNSHKDNPDFKDVLEWTRMMTSYEMDSSGATGVQTITSCGLELPLYCKISRINNSGNVVHTSVKQYYIIPTTAAVTDAIAIIRELAYLSVFDWHPFIYGYTGNVLEIPFGDFKVATTISQKDIFNINNAAVYGAFYAKSFYGDK